MAKLSRMTPIAPKEVRQLWLNLSRLSDGLADALWLLGVLEFPPSL